MSPEERARGLEVDVDTRIAELWAVAWARDSRLESLISTDADLAAAIGCLLRAAYGKGYCDALREVSAGRAAEIHRTHGYRLTT